MHRWISNGRLQGTLLTIKEGIFGKQAGSISFNLKAQGSEFPYGIKNRHLPPQS